MSDEIVQVPESPLSQQLKGQLRIGLSVFAGALVGKHILPAALANDGMVDLVTGLVAVGTASAWSWLRARLVHARMWRLAVDPTVKSVVPKP